MKKTTCAVFLLFVLMAVAPISADARKGRSHGGVSMHIGTSYRYHRPVWRHRPYYPGSGYRFYWRGPVVVGPWYPSVYYYGAPPVVIEQPPAVYEETRESPSQYWYYCQDPQGFYPYVKNCPGGWLKVVPEATPPNQ